MQGKIIPMELDTGTGTAMSLLSEETYQKFFSGISLQQSTVKLKSYSGENIPVLGQMDVLVKYNHQEKNLPLLVVKGGGCSLFGRNWFACIALNWGEVYQVCNNSKCFIGVPNVKEIDPREGYFWLAQSYFCKTVRRRKR